MCAYGSGHCVDSGTLCDSSAQSDSCPPPGSWSESCVNSSCSGSTLKTDCPDSSGVKYGRSFNTSACFEDVSNCNSELTCGGC